MKKNSAFLHCYPPLETIGLKIGCTFSPPFAQKQSINHHNGAAIYENTPHRVFSYRANTVSRSQLQRRRRARDMLLHFIGSGSSQIPLFIGKAKFARPAYGKPLFREVRHGRRRKFMKSARNSLDSFSSGRQTFGPNLGIHFYAF
jgi:hypothetical protein